MSEAVAEKTQIGNVEGNVRLGGITGKGFRKGQSGNPGGKNGKGLGNQAGKGLFHP